MGFKYRAIMEENNVSYSVAGIQFRTPGMSKHYKNYLGAAVLSTILTIAYTIFFFVCSLKLIYNLIVPGLEIIAPIAHIIIKQGGDVSLGKLKYLAYTFVGKAIIALAMTFVNAFCDRSNSTTQDYILSIVYPAIIAIMAAYQANRLFKLVKLQKLLQERSAPV